MSDDKSAQRLLKKHNPHVVGLFERTGSHRDRFQFFDGRSRLVLHAMAHFDGYPLEREYRFFIPISLLVVAGVLLPFVPIRFQGFERYIWYLIAAYLVAAAAFALWVAFHLIAIRTVYIAANRDLHSIDFASKADGVRKLIHTFKSIVRWRRFMFYSMNLGLISLPVAATMELFAQQGAHKPLEQSAVLFSGGLFLMSAGVMLLFGIGRKALTEGMDPTLALVHMVEEIGGQLLARGQVLVENGAEEDDG